MKRIPITSAPGGEPSDTVRFRDAGSDSTLVTWILGACLLCGIGWILLTVFSHAAPALNIPETAVIIAVITLFLFIFLYKRRCYFEVSPQYFAYHHWQGKPRIIPWEEVEVVYWSPRGVSVIGKHNAGIGFGKGISRFAELENLVLGYLLKAGKQGVIVKKQY